MIDKNTHVSVDPEPLEMATRRVCRPGLIRKVRAGEMVNGQLYHQLQ